MASFFLHPFRVFSTTLSPTLSPTLPLSSPITSLLPLTALPSPLFFSRHSSSSTHPTERILYEFLSGCHFFAIFKYPLLISCREAIRTLHAGREKRPPGSSSAGEEREREEGSQMPPGSLWATLRAGRRTPSQPPSSSGASSPLFLLPPPSARSIWKKTGGRKWEGGIYWGERSPLRENGWGVAHGWVQKGRGGAPSSLAPVGEAGGG